GREGVVEDQQYRGLVIVPTVGAAVAHARLDRGDGGKLHHRAVGGANNEWKVVRCVAQLIVRADGDRAAVVVEDAEGALGVGVGDRGAHVLHGQTHGSQCERVDA